jgi:hypothetical protein
MCARVRMQTYEQYNYQPSTNKRIVNMKREVRAGHCARDTARGTHHARSSVNC